MGDNYTNSANPDSSPLTGRDYNEPRRKSTSIIVPLSEAANFYSNECEFCKAIVIEARKKGLDRVLIDDETPHLVGVCLE